MQGHGTFVAGEIAALTDNGLGIAGLAPPARLLVAKVVRDDGSIAPRAEASAIRWAVRSGAKVINLSLGGTRDPADPSVDGFSYQERRAVDYAVRNGALVVASVGNGADAPSQPWRYASYPAALPHVLGVAAYGRSGDVPSFSNRDDVYVDIAAPGTGHALALPALARRRRSPGASTRATRAAGPRTTGTPTAPRSPRRRWPPRRRCSSRSTRSCGPTRCRRSSSAPPTTPRRGTAVPLARPDRDPLTGNGRLDVAAAIQSLRTSLPPADRFEPNDDAGREAQVVYGGSLIARPTLDTWDDPNDVYSIKLRKGQGISVLVRSGKLDTSVVLWKPGLRALALATDELRARRSVHPEGVPERLVVPRPHERLVLPAGQAGDAPGSGAVLASTSRHRSSSSGTSRGSARGVADHQRPRRHVAEHHGARADERLLADLDPG